MVVLPQPEGPTSEKKFAGPYRERYTVDGQVRGVLLGELVKLQDFGHFTNHQCSAVSLASAT